MEQWLWHTPVHLSVLEGPRGHTADNTGQTALCCNVTLGSSLAQVRAPADCPTSPLNRLKAQKAATSQAQEEKW
jgi:hypothetical protein